MVTKKGEGLSCQDAAKSAIQPTVTEAISRGAEQVCKAMDENKKSQKGKGRKRRKRRHNVYKGKQLASEPEPTTSENAGEDEEELLQLDAFSEETEEEEEETISIPAWENPNTKRRAGHVVVLLNQYVLDAMATDNLIWIMQAGF